MDWKTDVDLNLLRTFDVLMQERSVTRAAARLGRSQPAVSHALGRLRDTIGDPLLVRQGRRLVPTRRAEALAGPVHDTLMALQRALSQGADFEPATSTRRFTLACPDVLAAVIPQVLAACAEAPGVQIELRGRVRVGAGEVDQADVVLDVIPDKAPGVMVRPLGRLTQAVIARVGHPAIGDWSLDAYCAWPHITVRTADATPSMVERALAALGRVRTVGLVLPQLLLVPHVVGRSDLLFTGPHQVLSTLSEALGLVLLPPPCPLPEVGVGAMWAARHAADPGHRWFRQHVVEVMSSLTRQNTSPTLA